MASSYSCDVAQAIQSCRKQLGLQVGGIVHFEHINLVVGNKEIAETFYFDGLGLTLDPSKAHSTTTWANASRRQQFHLVLASKEEHCQIINGSIGLVVPSLDVVRQRLDSISEKMKGTAFRVKEISGPVGMLEVVCPWGNIFQVFDEKHPTFEQPKQPAPDLSKFEKAHLNAFNTLGPPGIRYVNFNVNEGQSTRIANFYEKSFGCPTVSTNVGEAAAAAVAVGADGAIFLFTELGNDRDQIAAQDGVHVCVHVTAFEQFFQAVPTVFTNPRFRYLDRCDTLEQAIGSRQFRFKDIVDEESGEMLYTLEHETRSIQHCSFMSPLVYNTPNDE